MTYRKPKTYKGATRLNIPIPAKAIRERYKPLADLCMKLVATNSSLSSSRPPKNKVRLMFDKGRHGVAVTPEGFPLGRYVRDIVLPKDKVMVEYNAEFVLLWLWERWLCDFSPEDIYAERRKGLMQITNIENNILLAVDKSLEEVYNGVIDIGDGQDESSR